MHKLKIKQQFFIVLLIVFIAFLLINITITDMAGKVVLEKNIQYADNTAEKIMAEITYLHENAASIFNYLQYNQQTQYFLHSNNSSSFYENVRELDSLLTGIHIIYPQLDDIALSGHRLYSNYLSQGDINSLIASSNNSFSACVGITQRHFIHQSYDIVRYVSPLYSNASGSDYSKEIGYCILSFQLNKLNWMRNTTIEDTSFILMDNTGNFYPINCTSETAVSVIDIYDSHQRQSTIDTFQYLIRTSTIQDSPLYLLSCIDKKALLQDVRLIQILILILSTTTIFILIIVITMVYHNIVIPIYALQKFMETISNDTNNLREKSLTVYGNYEVYQLSQAMNHMIQELEYRSTTLINTTKTLYETQMAKQEMEIALLRSQINPHFLYNSLETLQGLCMKNGLPAAATIANNLGKIFRYCIKGENLVPLSEEIKFVQAYVDIQKIRFAHKVSIIYNFSEPTLSMPVLSMILQPLLENAFYHSVEKRTETTTIYLGSFFQDEDLILVIQDDGIGIDPKVLQQLKKCLQYPTSSDPQHIGMTNVHMRIQLMYGKPYGLSIDSAPQEGTKITLRLKKIQQKGE